MKILVASHGHPQLSKGGAEISAFQLFKDLGAALGHDTWFLGCDRDAQIGSSGCRISQPYSSREYIYSANEFDWFKFANLDARFPSEFRDLLSKLRPDIVHFHHYVGFGVEAFLHVRETLPECKIILTLHEYLALCNHFGQMITNPHRLLCYEARPAACADCFSKRSATDFFLRKAYIMRFFELVDHFIAPSEFLAERYARWGISKDKISIIQNVIPDGEGRPSTRKPPTRGLLRVGFFGQISYLKGINVLFEAAAELLQRKVGEVTFEIYGDYAGQPSDFQEDFLARLSTAGRNVKFKGPYDQTQVDRLMQSVSLVLVPSIWWENSPVVIEEALRNRRPVICSDIGGMAEKIRDGVDGFHFPVGDSVALSTLISRLAKTPSRLSKLHASMRMPARARLAIDRHDELYGSVLHRNPRVVGL